MRYPLIIVTLFFLTLSSTGFSAESYWPQWRGPKRDDISTEKGLQKQWPAAGPELKWKARGLGGGYAGVSIAAGRILTMGEDDGSSHVMALKLVDGKQLWKTKVGKAGAPGWGGFSGPRCTPTIDGKLIYALGQYGELICVETATGKERWSKHYIDDFGADLPEWGFTESMFIEGDMVVGTPGGSEGTVIALDKKTGSTIWRCKGITDIAAYASLIAVDIDGVRQFLVFTQKTLAGVAAGDGTLLWSAERKGRTAVIPTPIYRDNHVYVASGYGVGCDLFKISKSGSTFGATQVYKNKDMVNHHGGVVMLGDHLYGYSDGKGWVCQEFKTGETVWREKQKLGKGSLTYADGHFYLRAESGPGTIALIEATPEGYREKSRFDQPDRSKNKSWPHPVIAGGQLFIRDQDVLLCYDIKTP